MASNGVQTLLAGSLAAAAPQRPPLDRPVMSVVMPVYNERPTVLEAISRVLALESALSDIRAGLDRGASTTPALELIIVDDASTDGGDGLLSSLVDLPTVKVLRHSANRGKGAALRTGFAAASGAVVVVQDADLEYDAAQWLELIQPLLTGDADMVLGSRLMPGAECRMPLATRLANRLITGSFNLVHGHQLTDIETCTKALRRETLQQILPGLTEDRFGIEIELVARVCQLAGARILERPIRYEARSRRSGKKIGWRDGVAALRCVWRYRRPSGSRLPDATRS